METRYLSEFTCSPSPSSWFHLIVFEAPESSIDFSCTDEGSKKLLSVFKFLIFTSEGISEKVSDRVPLFLTTILTTSPLLYCLELQVIFIASRLTTSYRKYSKQSRLEDCSTFGWPMAVNGIHLATVNGVFSCRPRNCHVTMNDYSKIP